MKRHRLLFVDTDPVFLGRLRSILHGQRRRWEMFFAADASSGQHLAAERTPDVMVLSAPQPGGEGLKLLRDLRAAAETADLPVVILTDRRAKTLKRRALRLGATDLLTKPIHQEDLVVRLRSVLALKDRQDQIKSLNADLERKVRRRTSELERSRLEVIWRLAKVGEYRDEDTGDHIIRVGRYCKILAARLRLAPETIETLTLAAPLHDIGKVGIPDAILLKQGRLSPNEWSVLETHCLIGSDILLRRPKGLALWGAEAEENADENRIVRAAASVALTHHERWDGRGYPLGLRGGNIPLTSRITAIADVYDALRSVRPYKQEYPHDKTLAIMRAERGLHFDPAIFDAFHEVADAFRAIRMEYEKKAAPAGRTRTGASADKR